MKTLHTILKALGVLVCLLVLIGCFVGFVTSCTVERFAPAVDTQVDSTLTAAGLAPLHVHKLKLTGPVTITVQAGQGNTSTSTTVGTDKTGQHSQAVSTGDDSPVVATEHKGGLPWYVYAGGVLGTGVLAVVGWAWVKRKLNPLG